MGNSPSSISPQAPTGGLFTPATPPPRRLPLAVWVAAGLLVLVVVVGVSLAGRHHTPATPNAALPLDPYAANLPISSLVMSESTSLSGGKSTFIDGHIHNGGAATVTAATIQVFFRNDENMPPTIETLPLSVVRTREPYVDTEPLSAAPLKPGDDREFRLIFETLPGNWNIQLPEIHIVHVSQR